MHPSRVLILSERALTELPPLEDVAELHTLDVGHNRLTSVPRLPDISGYLYLHDNALRSLPDALCDLARLRYLNVSANPIRALPARIGDMRGLIELRAERCGLTTLPASIGKLHALHELALRDNAIAEPPAEIGELTNLRRLDLRKLGLRWNPGLETPWLEALERRGCVIWR